MNKSLPKSSIIRELDDNIHKYADKEISDSDIIRIATRITSKQLKNVDELNQLAETNKKEFVNRLQQEADKQKETETKRLKMLEKAVKELHSRTANIKVVEQKFIEKSKEKDSKISTLLNRTTTQTDEIELLKNTLLKEQNSKREELRDRFYFDKIRKWRFKSWVEVSFSILLFIIPFLYLCYKSNWVGSRIVNTIIELKADFLISVIITIFGFIFSKITLPTLLGKYRNHSNIENFKKGLKLPDEYKELDKPSA
jgi:Fe2+ transport system protein B